MAITGFTATVSVNDTIVSSSASFAAFNETAKIKLPYGKVKILDFIRLSDTDKTIRKMPSSIDSGTLEFSMYYDADDMARLVALKGVHYVTGSTEVQWQIETPDGDTYTFTGYIEEVEPGEMDADALAMTTVKVAISGEITIS